MEAQTAPDVVESMSVSFSRTRAEFRIGRRAGGNDRAIERRIGVSTRPTPICSPSLCAGCGAPRPSESDTGSTGAPTHEIRGAGRSRLTATDPLWEFACLQIGRRVRRYEPCSSTRYSGVIAVDDLPGEGVLGLVGGEFRDRAQPWRTAHFRAIAVLVDG